MNPYDFVPVDFNRRIERRTPAGHDKFSGFSGTVKCTLKAETPLLVKGKEQTRGAISSRQNRDGDYIIPGSSLKGLFRSLVETVAHGCFGGKFSGLYEKKNVDYLNMLPPEFKNCPPPRDNQGLPALCPACRMFGWMNGGNVYTGKVFFSDALCSQEHAVEHRPVYTVDLMEPKPRHRAFYVNNGQIAGRKYYFHFPGGLVTQNEKTDYNQHLKPLGVGTQFKFTVTFNDLQEDELTALIYALVLEENMRHKMGYAKPFGLGSARIEIKEISITNAADRYRLNRQNPVFYHVDDDKPALQNFIKDNTGTYTADDSPTMQQLRRIWHWNPDGKAQYFYPPYQWFKDPQNADKPLSSTP